jgi:hypothetical protein
MAEEKINGVSIKHIERIIDIIRKRYSIVKRGTKYLETIERKFDLTALANIRDFVSHIETAFNENANEMEREESIIQSEEHLRRALVESHQIALEARLESFLDEYVKYEKDFMPNEAKYGINKITKHSEIRANIRKIQQYLDDGRTRKGTNIWNKEWEMGVEFFAQGYELAIKLQDELKGYKEKYSINKYAYDKHAAGKKLAIRLFIIGAIIALIASAMFSNPFIDLIKSLFKIK